MTLIRTPYIPETLECQGFFLLCSPSLSWGVAFDQQIGYYGRMIIYSAARYLSRSKFRGADRQADFVQDMVEALKSGDTGVFLTIVPWFRELRGIDGMLVPLPRSTVDRPSLLPFCVALSEYGVGSSAAALIRRATPVTSSRSLRQQGERGVDPETHMRSFIINPDILQYPAIILVDDVLTAGNTLAGAEKLLRNSGYNGSITGLVLADFRENIPQNIIGLEKLSLGSRSIYKNPVVSICKNPAISICKNPAISAQTLIDTPGALVEIYGDGSRLSVDINIDEKVVGSITSTRRLSGIWVVQNAKAVTGYGPLLYDLTMEIIFKLEDKGLCSDRGSVSKEAENVWRYYLEKRKDVGHKPMEDGFWRGRIPLTYYYFVKNTPTLQALLDAPEEILDTEFNF